MGYVLQALSIQMRYYFVTGPNVTAGRAVGWHRSHESEGIGTKMGAREGCPSNPLRAKMGFAGRY